MSHRRIEKLWDELREAKKPKRNLSKQPKKREVKLNTTEQFQETLSIAFDSEYLIQEYDSMMSEINSFISSNTKSLNELAGIIQPFDVLADRLIEQQKSIDKARESLGVSYEDLGLDYDAGDINEAIKIFATLRGKDEELGDSVSDLRQFLNKFQ